MPTEIPQEGRTEQPQFHIYHLPQTWLFVMLFGITTFVLMVVRQTAGAFIDNLETIRAGLLTAYLCLSGLFFIIGLSKFRNQARLLLVYADKCRLILPFGGNGFEWEIASIEEIFLTKKPGWRGWLPPLEAQVILKIKGRVIPVLVAQKIYRIKALKLQLLRLSAMANVGFFEQLCGAKERKKIAGPGSNAA